MENDQMKAFTAKGGEYSTASIDISASDVLSLLYLCGE
jgi:hypothetical protein